TIAEDAEDDLRRLIIDPADNAFWKLRINPTDDPLGRAPRPDVNAAVANALSARYDIVRANRDLDNAKTNIEYFNNQKLPDVRLETSYRGNGLRGTEMLRPGGVTVT